MKKGIRRYCEGTSCHGFYEMYHAKSPVWTIIWIIVLTMSVGITVYLITAGIGQFIRQPTTTLISYANEKDVLYPPLRVCYAHWLYWVDWQKVVSLNYSREAVLYGLSYVYDIASFQHFDINAAKNEFLKLLAEEKINSLLVFYKSIAKKRLLKFADDGPRVEFDQIELIFVPPKALFCYSVSSEKISQEFNATQHSSPVRITTSRMAKEISFGIADETYDDFKWFLHVDEYNAYMEWYIDTNSLYKIENGHDLTGYAPRVRFYPIGFDHDGVIKITYDVESYVVSLKASAYRWINKSTAPCIENEPSMSHNKTCTNLCLAQRFSKMCVCQYIVIAVLLGEDQFNKVCRNSIVFLPKPNVTEVYASYIANTTIEENCSENPRESLEYATCVKQCKESCETWSYSYSLSTSVSPSSLRKIGRKHVTQVKVNYPNGFEVVVMTETQTQSWQNFVGTIGGLLGIFFGGSVVSMFQIFYFCCCVSDDDS